MIEVINIYAIFKIKSTNKINLADHIFLKENMYFGGNYRPISCIFHFDISGSYHDASHKFRIHISINVHRTSDYQVYK